jgi:hypothetical protein
VNLNWVAARSDNLLTNAGLGSRCCHSIVFDRRGLKVLFFSYPTVFVQLVKSMCIWGFACATRYSLIGAHSRSKVYSHWSTTIASLQLCLWLILNDL